MLPDWTEATAADGTAVYTRLIGRMTLKVTVPPRQGAALWTMSGPDGEVAQTGAAVNPSGARRDASRAARVLSAEAGRKAAEPVG